MKTFIFLLAVLGSTMAEDIEYYTTADDHFDMDSLVKDPEGLQSFVDCFLDRKPCNPIPASYKLIVADSIEKACSRCNPAQKHLANTFVTGLRENNPVEYENFVRKFDPNGIYMDTFLKKVEGY